MRFETSSANAEASPSFPPKANRSTKPAFDELIYVERHHIETLFARLKSFLRIATRYEKLHRTFTAMVTLACCQRSLKTGHDWSLQNRPLLRG
jgi:transposase